MINNLVFSILVFIGFYAIFLKRNMIKIVIGLSILESAAFYWVIATNDKGGKLPFYQITEKGMDMIDALPQALTLTGIVIGASTTALLLTFVIELDKFTGTHNLDNLKGLDD
ncbi:MAG: sodium:proton antiporter [Bacillota bacterium]